ncbi:MAG: MOP flippase family protein [Acidobacteriaceae bacterium]|nr:MOP flippase family protein [Acidobacteriaceae bacterium]
MSVQTSSKVTGLTERALAGTGWSTIASVGKQLLTIASVTTVARVLGPHAYGLMGMAVIITGFISNFRDLGTATAIIQRRNVPRLLYSSVFWLNVLLGVALCILVAGTAPIAGRFFHTPEVAPILRVLSLSLLIASCGVVHLAILYREMRFKALGSVDLSAALASYIVALTGALAGMGVWSLVFASVIGSIVSTAGYWFCARFRPRFEFDWAEVRSIARFSSNLSAFGIVNYGYRNADNLIVGRVLGSTPLGFYQMAYNLMLTPISNISSVIAGVLFPAFSKIQDDNERFRNAYVRACMLTALLTFPVMAGLGVVADPMIRAVLGTKWLGAIRPFQILAAVGLVQSLYTTVGVIYQAKGRTDWMFRWGVVVLITTVTAFLIGVRFGINGVAAAYAITFLAVLTIPGFAIPFRLIGLSFWDFARALLPQLLITGGMAGVCIAWQMALAALRIGNAWIVLLSTSLIGAGAYVGALAVSRPDVLDLVNEILGNSSHGLAATALSLLRRLRLLRSSPAAEAAPEAV